LTPHLRPVPANPRLREAVDTVERLRQALAKHGVRLPSLDVDTHSYAHPDRGVLVELGRCNVTTAQALIAALAAREGGEADR
jgi:hypothetical protein